MKAAAVGKLAAAGVVGAAVFGSASAAYADGSGTVSWLPPTFGHLGDGDTISVVYSGTIPPDPVNPYVEECPGSMTVANFDDSQCMNIPNSLTVDRTNNVITGTATFTEHGTTNNFLGPQPFDCSNGCQLFVSHTNIVSRVLFHLALGHTAIAPK